MTSTSTKDAIDKIRLDQIDALRGFASFAVCWFHLTNGRPGFLPEGLLKWSGAYGWLGVEVFFVISGFIIPWALHKAAYRLKKFFRFVAKRVVRLDPPYIVAIALALALQYASSFVPGFQGAAFDYNPLMILLHLGYLNAFFGYDWVITVFWTLAVEFQYYILVGLTFPLIAHEKRGVRLATFLVFGILAQWVSNSAYVLNWLFLFMMGMAAFQRRATLISSSEFWLILLYAFVGAFINNSPAMALTGLLATLIISFWTYCPRVLYFLGNISYSLYLVHIPFGGRVVNVGSRWATSLPEKMAVLALALAVSLLVAYCMYIWVERPARIWASKISY